MALVMTNCRCGSNCGHTTKCMADASGNKHSQAWTGESQKLVSAPIYGCLEEPEPGVE